MKTKNGFTTVIGLLVCVYTNLCIGNEIIDKINTRCSQIQSLTASLECTGKRRFITISSYGTLCIQKPTNFRIVNKSKVDGYLNLDAGCDGTKFWMWSRFVRPVSLYWGLVQDLDKLNIDSSLHPFLLLETLGLLPIDTNSSLYNQNGCLIVSQTQNNITKLIKINTTSNLIIGRYIFDSSKNLVSSCQIQEFNSFGIPTRCKIYWPKESLDITINLSNIILNSNISTMMWNFPSYQPIRKIDTRDN